MLTYRVVKINFDAFFASTVEIGTYRMKLS